MKTYGNFWPILMVASTLKYIKHVPQKFNFATLKLSSISAEVFDKPVYQHNMM